MNWLMTSRRTPNWAQPARTWRAVWVFRRAIRCWWASSRRPKSWALSPGSSRPSASTASPTSTQDSTRTFTCASTAASSRATWSTCPDPFSTENVPKPGSVPPFFFFFFFFFKLMLMNFVELIFLYLMMCDSLV